MPELPEVETVCRGLAAAVKTGTTIERVEVRRRDLRTRIPRGIERRLEAQPILGFRRRGKYLLWDTPDVVVLSHLGMSGTWRLAPAGDERVHDHVYVHLGSGARLAFRDPRRFGLLDLAPTGAEERHRLLAGLGPDPLDPERFHADYLRGVLRGRRAPVKNVLLDQRAIAGIGNIYAAEVLHRAGIRPQRPACRVRGAEAARLVAAVREVLLEAIDAGGSTLRDFRETGGLEGWFQHSFRVYGREGLPCVGCGRSLRSSRLGGRAGAWCSACQR